VIEQVSANDDLSTFIKNNNTDQQPPAEIQYTPYSINLRRQSYETSQYPLETVYNVIVELQSTFEKVNETDYVYIK
jgi:hypothetical protein